VKRLTLILITLALIAAALVYVLQTTDRREPRDLPGNVYDYHSDPKLVQTIRLTLSLHAVMSRLSASNPRDGTPDVSYTIENVYLVKANLVEVRYHLTFTYSGRRERQEHTKRFKRRPDGDWSAAPD